MREVLYKVGEVAKMFGRSPQWVKLCEQRGELVDDYGRPIRPKRSKSFGGKNRSRQYTEDQVAQIAYSLLRFERITLPQRDEVLRRMGK